MGLCSKVVSSAAPTPTDCFEGATAKNSGWDIEKNGQSVDVKSDSQEHRHVHSEIEKRVVRKLDSRVLPLVTTLCEAFVTRPTVGEAV